VSWVVRWATRCASRTGRAAAHASSTSQVTQAGLWRGGGGSRLETAGGNCCSATGTCCASPPELLGLQPCGADSCLKEHAPAVVAAAPPDPPVPLAVLLCADGTLLQECLEDASLSRYEVRPTPPDGHATALRAQLQKPLLLWRLLWMMAAVKFSTWAHAHSPQRCRVALGPVHCPLPPPPPAFLSCR
jgi:hypothetical protein